MSQEEEREQEEGGQLSLVDIESWRVNFQSFRLGEKTGEGQSETDGASGREGGKGGGKKKIRSMMEGVVRKSGERVEGKQGVVGGAGCGY